MSPNKDGSHAVTVIYDRQGGYNKNTARWCEEKNWTYDSNLHFTGSEDRVVVCMERAARYTEAISRARNRLYLVSTRGRYYTILYYMFYTTDCQGFNIQTIMSFHMFYEYKGLLDRRKMYYPNFYNRKHNTMISYNSLVTLSYGAGLTFIRFVNTTHIRARF